MIHYYVQIFFMWKPLTNVHLEDKEIDVKVTLRWNMQNGGTRWPSWLRHCATSRKVSGLIADGIFYCRNSSGSTMALGPTLPLTKMSTRNISWGVKAADA